MRTTVEFLDALKARHGGISDYQAAKLLGVKQPSVSRYRSGRGTFSDDVAVRCAALLGIDEVYVLACCQAERAQNEQARETWERIAARFAAVLAVAIGGTLAPVPEAAASHNLNYAADGLHIMRQRTRRPRRTGPSIPELVRSILYGPAWTR